MKHAFVTGATGFLGVNLVNRLIAEGWQVTAIHRNSISHPLLVNQPIRWIKASLDDAVGLKQAMPKEPFVIFHLAADTTQWKPNYPRQTKTIVGGTENLMGAAKGAPLSRFIYTSSITAFGAHSQTITEQSPSFALQGGHNYGIAKWTAEEMIRKAVNAGDIDAVILNPCHIIGPWDTNNWIQLFKAVMQDDLPGIPPAKGNFAWVHAVAAAHIQAVTSGVSGENYILGGPYHGMLDMVNEVQRQLGKPLSKRTSSPWLLRGIEPLMRMRSWVDGKEPQLTPDKVKLLTHVLQADDAKARTVLNYTHKTLPEMVEETLAWLTNNQ